MNTSPKTILITGISRGIGKALAEKFLREGYSVIGTSQTGSVDFTHEHLKIFQLDLSSTKSIKKCVENITVFLNSSDNKIDILINNAGTLLDEDETAVVIDMLRQTLEVNLIGTIDFTEQMISLIQNDGHILNIASSAGSLAETVHVEESHHPYHYPAYKISKAALNMYTRTLAVRLKHEGNNITVSSVHPGWVKTDMGGDDAPMLPEQSAEHIYTLALSKPETGQFWFKGQKYPW